MDCLWLLCSLIIAHWVKVAIVREDATLMLVQQLMAHRILLSQDSQRVAILGAEDDYSVVACHNFTSVYLGISDPDIADTVCSRIYWVPERSMLTGEARIIQDDELFALPEQAARDMCSRLIAHNPALIPEELAYYALIVLADVCHREGALGQTPA